jgi:hypothetical protein
MHEDDKTARGRHGPDSGKPLIVRTTAPAGTPARRSPVSGPDGALPVLGAHGSSPMPALPSPAPGAHVGPARFQSDRPVDTMTPPRTVGGHTARLNVAEGIVVPPLAPDDAAFGGDAPAAGVGPRAAPRSPAPIAGPSIPVELEPPSAPAPPRTVGGTMRMPTVEPGAEPPKANAPAKGKPAAPAGEGEPTFGQRLFAPVSVAVGLVFFALGAIGTLTFETLWGGLARAPVAAAGTPTAATATAPPGATSAAPSLSTPPPTVASATSAAPVATLIAPAPPLRPSAAVRPPSTSHSGGKPPRGSVFEPKGD